MSVRKRTLPGGAIRWLVDYRDGSGTRRFKQFPTQREAIKFRDATGVAVRAGVHVADAASTTVKEAGELWLEKCRLDGLETGTVRNYKEHLNLHILPLIGDTKLTRLTRPVVESFRDKLLETRSQTTARKVVGSLKSLVSEAQRRGLVAQNVAMGTKVKTASRHEKKVTIPTKDEIRTLLSKTGELLPATVPWRPFVTAALLTGLRASELRGLVWEHVDFEKKLIRVRQRADYRCKLGSPKTKKGTRDVPLAPMVTHHDEAMAARLPQIGTRARLPHKKRHHYPAFASAPSMVRAA